MCNRSITHALWPRNTEFRSVFAVNWHFSVKSKAHLDFESKFEFFKMPKNLYTRPLCVSNLVFGLHD
jgi:hypothetical protein